MTSTYALGAVVPLRMLVTDAAGAPANAGAAAGTVYLPDGTTATITWGAPSPTGTYDSTYTPAVAGNFSWQGTTSTPTTATELERFRVRDTLADYATLTDLKSYLGITDTDDDDSLYIALDAAQAWIDAHYGPFNRAAVTARVFRDTSDGLLIIDPAATATDLVVAGSDGDGTYTTIASTGYVTYPDNAVAKGLPITGIRFVGTTPPCDAYGVQVSAAWGWPSVPADVTDATLILASRLFKRKNSPEGVAGWGDLGVVRITAVDVDVKNLLSRFAPQLVA